ncbi:MAG: hypothetical protein A2W05_07480 [Candidatus Schekmanbacteria bacterium RBG_16_38_10]|uniref:Uncharacterized protein n=1 Tax=Candidatus Schekmanbacteria bacterium RBG_16_38_10 TaxID=1817879 RepID=A0A1F7RUD5_9BACT|nr:MAG: hypothetical protein A2W05_07480 [Candidatus Schekmanbacteria bacterium RBG_16_38_10]
MPDPTYTLEIEFSTGSYTDVTSDCFRISINRETATYERGLSMGRCELELDNHERRYSPLNTSGPHYGYLNPNKKVKVVANYNTTTYTLFTGFIDSYTIDPQIGMRSVYIQASDMIKNMKLQTINMPFRVNIGVGSLFSEVLSYATVPLSDRHVHDFMDTVAFVWFENRKPTDVLDNLLTYGNFGAYVSGSGILHIHDRHFNMEGSVVASYNEFFGLSYSRDESNIGNIIRVSGNPREQSTELAVVAGLQEVITIPGSSKNSFWLSYMDPITQETNTPVNSIIFPVPQTDYTFNSAPTGLGTDLTSFMTITGAMLSTTAIFSLTNTIATKGYVTKFNLRGYPILRKPTVSYEAEVASSQAAYGRRAYIIESDFINTLQYSKDYVTYLMYEHLDPVDNVPFSLKNQFPDILQRELTDIVHIVESNTALSIDGIILSLSHDINFERGIEHSVQYDVDRWADPEWLLLEHPTKGVLDSRKVGF